MPCKCAALGAHEGCWRGTLGRPLLSQSTCSAYPLSPFHLLTLSPPSHFLIPFPLYSVQASSLFQHNDRIIVIRVQDNDLVVILWLWLSQVPGSACASSARTSTRACARA